MLRKLLVRILLGLLATLILVVAIAVVWLDWADLRSAELRDDPRIARRQLRGRELLERVAEAHGQQAWERHQTYTVKAVDEWQADSSWWQRSRQHLASDRLLGTFSSRVTLLDGPRAGEVWGLQNWAPYKIEVGTGQPAFLAADLAIEFYLPTLQYFDELPWRLAAAEIVLAEEPIEHRGRRYERVFATWGEAPAHAEHDQYIAWIDPDTHLLAKVEYTLRDAVDFSAFYLRPVIKAYAIGTMHFADYRTVGDDGALFAFLQTVTLGRADAARDPLASHFMHRLVVEDVCFDAVAAADLLPDPERGGGGDHKQRG